MYQDIDTTDELRSTNGALESRIKTTKPVGITLDVREVADLLGFSSRTVYRLVNRGDFPQPRKIGRLSKWDRNEVTDWWNSKATQ